MAATQVVSRENIESWAPDSPKLYLFRRAIEEMQKISDEALGDERGYQWCAGVHGGFGGEPFCHHGDAHFLSWHRPYILDYELKLRDQIRKIASDAEADEWRLPYWDWAAEDTQGLPEAFTVPTYNDGGKSKKNPLLRQPYQLPYFIDDLPANQQKTTWRRTGDLSELQALRPMVVRALRERDYTLFSRAIENPHNFVHVWVQGFMGTFRSSFDPIFWVHHCNIDRYFWMWQQTGATESIPDFVRTNACTPFSFEDISAEAFFDTRELGYTYAESRTMVTRSSAVNAMVGAMGIAAEGKKVKPPMTLQVELGEIPRNLEEGRVHVHGVHHPESNHAIRVFANREELPNGKTPTTAKEHYLGTYWILGHGKCPGAPGHCDPKGRKPDGLRRVHHLAPFDLFLDVTDTLKPLLKTKKKSHGGRDTVPLTLSIVVVNNKGAQVPNETIKFDNISFTTH